MRLLEARHRLQTAGSQAVSPGCWKTGRAFRLLSPRSRLEAVGSQAAPPVYRQPGSVSRVLSARSRLQAAGSQAAPPDCWTSDCRQPGRDSRHAPPAGRGAPSAGRGAGGCWYGSQGRSLKAVLAQTHIFRSRLGARAAAGPRAGQDGHAATASCDTAGTSRNPKRNEILEVRTRQASAPLTAQGVWAG